MTEHLQKDQFQIEEARDDDWPWIVEFHAETAWQSLIPELKKDVTKKTVRECVGEQVAKSRKEERPTNQAFIARDARGIGQVLSGWVECTVFSLEDSEPTSLIFL